MKKYSKLLFILLAMALIIAVVFGLVITNKKKIASNGSKDNAEFSNQARSIENYAFDIYATDQFINYLDELGTFNRLYFNDQKKVRLLDTTLTSVKNVVYSQDGEAAIVKFDNDSNFLFDFKAMNKNKLASDIKKVVFTKTNKIIYNFNSGALNNISQSDPDGSNWEKIIELNLYQPDLALSPDEKTLLLTPTQDDCENNNIYALDLPNKKMIQTTNQGCAINSSWSPDGKSIAYYAFTDSRSPFGFLWIGNQDGSNQKNTEVKSTYYNKIIWRNNENLILAIDANLAEPASNAGYYLYNYNLSSSQLTQIKLAKQITGINQMEYNSLTKLLYLVNLGELMIVDLNRLLPK